jgi:diguanylate cyclase (GGDEF)-like protein/PAS domain S-box-containing protein
MSASALSDFIRDNIESILGKWEEFARELSAGRELDTTALRDHAQGILLAIAADLECAQTPHQQSEKSKGRAPKRAERSDAQHHGTARLSAGFSLMEELSEFRALRASVMQLWAQSNAGAGSVNEDLVRFNEAVCQALTESVEQYSFDRTQYVRMFDTLLSSSGDLSFIIDVQGNFIYANHAVAALYGMSLPEIVGRNLFSIETDPAAELPRHLHTVIDSAQSAHVELRCPSTLGKDTMYDLFLVPVAERGAAVEAIAGTARDVTERRAWEERIKRSATHDNLTGLPNRRLFLDRLDLAIKRAARSGVALALLFIDLDGFKEVNDSLGHDGGDQLLREAAQRIRACVRDIDTVARLGGDEFTVIFSDVSQVRHVDILAQHFLEELSRPFLILEKEVSVSGSIGVTLFPQDGHSRDELIKNADQAMYVAKNCGRNRFSFFTPDMRAAACTRLRVIEELRTAMAEHQLRIHYQPIVELANGTIVKAEALLRWQHPRSGLIASGQFVGLAEEAGLIGEIDAWVFGQAIACARQWSQLRGTPFQIGVNHSSVEFIGKAPLKSLARHAGAPELLSGSISVDVSESVLLNNLPAVREKLERLRHAGVQLAVDNFGTGFSSMTHLQKCHVDYVKIDQSFVRARSDDRDRRAFAEMAVMVAHRFGMKVIAEGVETAEQRDWLRGADCDYAQGNLFSAAVSSQSFESMLRDS